MSILVLFLAITITIAGCSVFGQKKEIKPFHSDVVHPEWSKNSVLYEVNVRQYTEQGTFNAFAEHLPRLKALVVYADIPYWSSKQERRTWKLLFS